MRTLTRIIQLLILIGLMGFLVGPAALQESGAAFEVITADNAAQVQEIYRIQPAEMVTLEADPYRGDVYSYDYSHDSHWLATSGYGSVIKIWDVKTSELLHAWNIGTEPNAFVQVEFSPDDRWLVVFGRFGHITTLFDMHTGNRMSLFDPQGEGGYKHFSFSPDGRIAVGFEPNRDTFFLLRIEIWDINTQTRLHTLRPSESLQYSPDGRYLMSGITLYDAQTWQILRSFEMNTPDSWQTSTFLDHGSSLLYLMDNTLGLWDIETGQWVWQQEFSSEDVFFSLLPDEQDIFLTQKREEGVWFSPILNVKTGETLTVWEENTGVTIEQFSPNGQVMLLSVKNSIELWDVRDLSNKKYIATIYTGVQPYAAFSPDGRTIVVQDGYDIADPGNLIVLAVTHG